MVQAVGGEGRVERRRGAAGPVSEAAADSRERSRSSVSEGCCSSSRRSRFRWYRSDALLASSRRVAIRTEMLAERLPADGQERAEDDEPGELGPPRHAAQAGVP